MGLKNSLSRPLLSILAALNVFVISFSNALVKINTLAKNTTEGGDVVSSQFRWQIVGCAAEIEGKEAISLHMNPMDCKNSCGVGFAGIRNIRYQCKCGEPTGDFVTAGDTPNGGQQCAFPRWKVFARKGGFL